MIGERALGAVALRRPSVRLLGEQAAVATGQIASGVGNLAFAVVMARLLDPASFAALAAFLAMFLLVNVPASSLTAGSALDPRTLPGLRRRTALIGAGVGLLVIGSAPWVSSSMSVSVWLIVVLGLAVPCAGLLAIERGALYASRDHRWVVASLVAEPSVRLSLGIGLAAVAGPTGAAIAVVLGSYLALLLARWPQTKTASVPTPGVGSPGSSGRTAGVAWTVGAFLLLAVVQNQDILLSKALLEPGAAAAFAVLSTLGGAAAFATSTIPVVLIPRAGEGRAPLGSALTLAALLGLAGVIVVALAPGDLIAAAFGEGYRGVAPLVVPYLGAMTMFGLARVLVAHRCATGSSRVATVVVLVGAAALQTALIATGPTDAGGVARATFVATAVLLVGLATVTAAPFAREGIRARIAPLLRSRAMLWLGIITLVALILRLLVGRGIWLDEATSIYQARLPFGDMLESLRYGDVHPPGHYVLLWFVAHVWNTSEIAMRTPSIIAGVLTVPALYAAGRELFDRRTGFIVAILGCTAPFLVWYSQEARMYSMLMLFSVIAVWAQARVIKRGGIWPWVVFTLASIAMLYTHYFVVIQVGLQQLVFLGESIRRLRRDRDRSFALGWLAVLAVSVALLLPLVGFTLDQFQLNEGAGKGFTDGTSRTGAAATAQGEMSIYRALANVVWALWGYHSDDVMARIAALWPLGMLMLLFLLGRGASRWTRTLLVLTSVPMVVFFTIGLFKQNLFEVRYFSGVAPLLLLLIGRGIARAAPTARAAAIACLLLAGSFTVGLYDQQVNRENPRIYDFDAALAAAESEIGPDGVLVYEPAELEQLVDYYAPGLRSEALGEGLPSLEDHGRILLLGSFLDKPSVAGRAGGALAELKEAGTLVSTRAFGEQVKLWIFR